MSPTPINVPAEILLALESGADLVISISGGKDSQAMLSAVTRFWRERAFAGRMLAVHSDLGRAEWIETPDIVERQAEAYGVELEIVRRAKGDLVQRIQDRAEQLAGTGRPFWPSSANRYCTSDLKRDPIDKFLRTFDGVVISAEGVRAEESRARAAKPCWEPRKRITTRTRTALTWRPIHNWSESDVWAEIGGRSGDLVHPAYALGNERLSCSLCVLASRNDLVNGRRHNPALFEIYRELEESTGFTFRDGMSLEVLTNPVN